MVATGPGGLSRARSDGITGFAARGVPGLESAIPRRPARRIPAGAGWGRSPGGVPRPLALDRSAATAPWPDAYAPVAARLRTDALAANRTQQPNRAPPKMWSIGMAGISFVVSLGRGGRPRVLSTGPKLLSHRIPSKAPWAVNGRRSCDQAASEDRVKGSTSNGVCAAFHVEPNGSTWVVALGSGSAERGPMVLTVSGLRGIQHAELEIPPRLSPVCGGPRLGKDLAARGTVSSRSR